MRRECLFEGLRDVWQARPPRELLVGDESLVGGGAEIEVVLDDEREQVLVVAGQ